MAALPSPLVPIDQYLNTSYPDGDREYLDGLVVERNMGTPGHSALQKILIVHLAAFEKQLGIAVRPECRTRIRETRRDPFTKRQSAGHSAPVPRA